MGESESGQNRVLAVDLGGTQIRAAVVSAGGDVTHRQSVATDAPDGPDAVIERIVAVTRRVADEAELAPDAPIGVSSPGPLDPRTGVVLFTPNLPGWRDVALGGRLGEATERRVWIANDANCAVLGEARFGAGKGTGDFVYLALGTGVGGGVMSGGKLVDGVRGLGAELGHTVIAMDGPRCTCGSVGCLEAFASGWAIAREGQLVATTEDGAAIRREAGDGAITPASIAAAAERGDRAAQAIIERAGRALGAAMGAFVNIFNPELIVIGGGVAALGERLLGPARATMPVHSFISMRECVKMVDSELGIDTSLLGAAALALDALDETGR